MAQTVPVRPLSTSSLWAVKVLLLSFQVLKRSETARVQAKMSGVAHSSYSGRGILCNGLVTGGLDRVFGEALAREIAGRSRPPPACGDDALGANRLGVERGERSRDGLGSNAARLEVVPDEEVARPAPCKQLGATSRESSVVDGACPHQPVDGFLPRRPGNVRPGQPVRKLPLREVALRQRARSPADRLVQPQLTPYSPRSLPVELDTDIQARSEDDLGGKSPPRLALELDLDSSSRPGAEGANPWRRPSP